MNNLKWSDAEKKLSRRVFEAAVEAELEETLAEFRSKAAALRRPQDMWALEDYLARRRREIDTKYDYRYSQLLVVFARLVWEGRIDQDQLSGLSAEKLSCIQRILEL